MDTGSAIFQLEQRVWTREEIRKAIEIQNARIIPDPPGELREIYEINHLIEMAHLRAEKYDSPEHREQLKEIQGKTGSTAVPRNKQNPNYDQILEIVTRLRNGLDKETLAVKERARAILEVMNQRNGLPSPTLSEREREDDPTLQTRQHCLRQLGLLKGVFLGIAPLMPESTGAHDWKRQLQHLEEWRLPNEDEGDDDDDSGNEELDAKRAWEAILDIRLAKNLGECFNYFFNRYKSIKP